MSFRNLVEPNCGAPNPLMRLGTHLTDDAARKDEGLSGMSAISRPRFDDNPFVNEFLGESSLNSAPSTFRMHDLMKELVGPPPIGNQRIQDPSADWANEFSSNHVNFELPLTNKSESDIWGSVMPQSSQSMINWTDQFLDMNANTKDQVNLIPEAAANLIENTHQEERNYSEVNNDFNQ